MRNNKGFTLIELIVSFVMITILSLTIFKTVIDVEKKQVVNVAYNNYIVFQSTINNAIQKDFANKSIESLELCGSNCYNIEYNDGIIKKLSINTNKKIITYDGLNERLPKNFEFYGNIMVDTKNYDNTTGYNSMTTIRIPVKSTILIGDLDLRFVYQFDNNENPITSTILDYSGEKGVNIPRLNTGMTPIKWDGSKWVSTTKNDPAWYDYTNKKWANVMTEDGSMWVWIPRYVYKISSGWHLNTTGTIDIQFSMGTDDTRGGTVTLDTGTTSNASNNKWTNHPAFTFGSTELTGIWVAKFEATASEGVANGYTSDSSCPVPGDNVTTKTIKVVPNVASWRCIIIGNAFTASRNMETKSIYGWGTSGDNIDTHLMKNVEWGAVSYLSKSIYGKDTVEVWVNNDQNYTTGCAANSASQGTNNGCLNTYESTNGVQASTTGTIYGVYDMSGGSWERVSAYVDNLNSNLNTYGLSIINANIKYKDIYQKNTTDDNANNYLLTVNKKGDAIYETSSNGISTSLGWFTDFTNTPYTSNPWFSRGGAWGNGSGAGLYYFYCTTGSANSTYGFRPVLLVSEGL